MKKFLIILILFLVGCASERLPVNVILADISAEMGSTANFSVSEEFSFIQFGVNDDQPHNMEIKIENHIVYDNSVIYTDTNMTYETMYHSVEERGNYKFKSYKDLLSNVAYVKPENDWYSVELPQMYKLGMGSIDPVAIVNAILYDNLEINFRGDEGISVDPSLYRVARADLSSEVFEELFASTIYQFIDLNYDYTIAVTMRFNAEFQVEYIDFDLSELIQQYSDDFKYVLKSTLNQIYGSYRLNFSNYGEESIDNVTEYIDWVTDEDYKIENKTGLDEVSVGDVRTDVIYSSETQTFTTNVSIELNKDLKYMYYELSFYKEEQLMSTYSSEYYNVLEFDDLVLYYFEAEYDADEVVFLTRYITADSSNIVDQITTSEIEFEEPVTEVELDVSVFRDKADDLVPNYIIESIGIIQGKPTYELTFDMYAVEESRNINASIYLFDGNSLMEIIEIDNINIRKFESYELNKQLAYKPTSVYIDVNYKTSYLWFNEKRIKLQEHLVEDPKDFSNYNESLAISAFEIEDAKWYAVKYLISFEFLTDVELLDVYVYLVDIDSSVVGWEHISASNVGELYEYVTDLYQDDIDTIYLEIVADGIEYEIISNYGIIIQ